VYSRVSKSRNWYSMNWRLWSWFSGVVGGWWKEGEESESSVPVCFLGCHLLVFCFEPLKVLLELTGR
jgi:hypothetical protein